MTYTLILDANQRSALATTRSLGRHNIPIVTADHTSTSLAGSSHYSSLYIQYPDPSKSPKAFISKLSKLIEQLNINIVFPMTELTSTLLIANRNQLPPIILPFPDLNTINSISDKSILMRKAQQLGIPIPQTWHENSNTKLETSLQNLNYPIVLKPGKSWINQNSKWIHTGVRFADTPEEANSIINSDCSFSSHPFMLQECVSGEGQGVFALYNNGQAVAFFSHRRIREKPPWGGVSVLSESIPIDPTLLAYSRKLLDAAKWHGVAMVEFKVSDEKTPYLMEINTRFWGSLQLAIDAGVDFPWMLYEMSSGNSVEPVNHYKLGIRLRWILGDLDSLYISIKDAKLTLNQKFKAIFKFLNPISFKTKHEVNRWNDLSPFWWEIKKYLRDLFS